MILLFNLLAILSFALCLQTLQQIYRHWREFTDDEVTLHDQMLAQRLAIFGLLPLGVLVHELGHCLATWQVGGTVSSFQWRFSWGYIVPSGDFSALEKWWIALSGNLISSLLVIAALALIPRIRKRILAEVLFFFACAQAITSLIAYPLLSLNAGWGDWSLIYALPLRPYAIFTLILHVALIVALWRFYHGETALCWRLARHPAIASEWLKWKRTIRDHPDDLEARLALAELLRQHHEAPAARALIRHLPAGSSQPPRLQLMRASLAASPRRAIQLCQPLLATDLPRNERIQLDRILSFSYLRSGRIATALRHADHGLTLDPNQPNLRFTRACIYWQSNKRQEALDDVQVAIAQGPSEVFREQLQRWQQQIDRSQRKASPNKIEAIPPVARRELTLPQLLVAGLGFIPILGFPFGLVTLLWGLLCWKKNGCKLVCLGLAGPTLSLLILFSFVHLITSLWFPDVLSESARLQTRLTETAAMIEAVKRNTGKYPENLKALAVFPNYSQIYDYTQPQSTQLRHSATGQLNQPTYYYQRLVKPPGYYLFALGLDGQPFTADDVRVDQPSAFPGLRQPRKG